MICSECGRDINEIGQDNVSCIAGHPLCEDCFCSCNDFDEEDEDGSLCSGCKYTENDENKSPCCFCIKWVGGYLEATKYENRFVMGD